MLTTQGCSVLEYDTSEFSKLTILSEYRDFHFIVHFHLPTVFPKQKPQITLQSVYHMTPQGHLYEEILDEVPYNPRWNMNHMIKSFLSHITDKIHKFQKDSVKFHHF